MQCCKKWEKLSCYKVILMMAIKLQLQELPGKMTLQKKKLCCELWSIAKHKRNFYLLLWWIKNFLENRTGVSLRQYLWLYNLMKWDTNQSAWRTLLQCSLHYNQIIIRRFCSSSSAPKVSTIFIKKQNKKRSGKKIMLWNFLIDQTRDGDFPPDNFAKVFQFAEEEQKKKSFLSLLIQPEPNIEIQLEWDFFRTMLLIKISFFTEILFEISATWW